MRVRRAGREVMVSGRLEIWFSFSYIGMSVVDAARGEYIKLAKVLQVAEPAGKEHNVVAVSLQSSGRAVR